MRYLTCVCHTKEKAIKMRLNRTHGILVLFFIVIIFISGCVQTQTIKEEKSCSEECYFDGRSCIDNNIYSCTNTDDDSCKEKVLVSSCLSNEECSNDQCIRKAYCGDGFCNSNENCSSCQQDCGACTSVVVDSSKKYGPNQIAGCEEGYIWIGDTNDTDVCYRYYAVKESNYLYCEQISDLAKRDDCYYTVGSGTENSYVCGLISTSSGCEGKAQGSAGMLNCKDSCYHDIAVKKLIPSICDDITTQNGKDACYWRVALNSKNSNLCSKIINSVGTISNDFCYYSIAVQTNNINICSPISDAEQHDQCMMSIIRSLKLKDSTLCNQMTTNWKVSCESEIETGNYLN